MNPANRHVFDRFASRVLHAGMRGVKRITGVFRKGDAGLPANPRHVLVIKLWGLGALVCATPALAALRRRFADARLTLLTSRGLERLYDAAGLYDKALPWSAAGLHDLPRAIRRLRARLRDDPPDLAVSLDGLSSLSALLAHTSGARATAGFSPPGGGGHGIHTLAVPLDLDEHAIRVMLGLARALGAKTEEQEPIAPRLRTNEREQALASLRQWGLDEHALPVGVNMNTGEFALHRAWPPEKFVLLAQAIEEMGEYRTVFIGSGAEQRYVGRHVKHMETLPVDLTGRTSVRQLAALLAQFHLLVTNDSGPLHLAAALGVPTVSIFGPETPARFGPPRDERHAVIYGGMECSPCLNFMSRELGTCVRGHACVRDLTLEQVRAEVEEMLDHLSDPENPPWAP